MSQRLNKAWTSLRDFLRGFVGIRGVGQTSSDPQKRLAGLPSATCQHHPTPADVRAALAARSAGRATCC